MFAVTFINDVVLSFPDGDAQNLSDEAIRAGSGGGLKMQCGGNQIL
jgi:hypothetical protein